MNLELFWSAFSSIAAMLACIIAVLQPIVGRYIERKKKVIVSFETDRVVVLPPPNDFKQEITSNIPITIYPVDKTEKCEIWLPLSSHVGVLFSENKKYKRNHLINRTEKTESLNCLVANNANLYYQKTALLIGNNKRCLTKAYNIVSNPHFRLSDL